MSKYHYNDDDRSPRFAISSIIQRGADMAAYIRTDGKELAAAGLDLTISDDIEVLVKQCSLADADWNVAYDSQIIYNGDLKEFTLECHKFKSGALRVVKATDSIRPVSFTIPTFKRGSSRADLVQDLYTVHAMFRDFKNDLGYLPFCTDYEQKALLLSNTLSDRITKAAVNKLETKNLKSTRNILCNRLYDMIKEVTAAARIAFRNTERLGLYYFDNIR